MDIPVELIKWIVIVGLIYYILDKTPIGTPIKRFLVGLMVFLWHRVSTRGAFMFPELSEKMTRIEREYHGMRKRRNPE